MLGVQQTHAAVPHHPTSRSAATGVSAGPLRPVPVPKRRPTGVQKQHVLGTVSSTQENSEAQADASAENSSAWPEPRDEHVELQQKVEDNENGNPGESVEEQNTLDDPSRDQEQAGNGTVGQEKRDEGGEGEDVKPDGANDYTRHPSSPLSELSPAPDEDDNPTQVDGGAEGDGSEKVASGYFMEGQPPIDRRPDSADSIPLPSDTHATGGTTQSATYSALSGTTIHQAASVNPFGSGLPTVDGRAASSTTPTSSQVPYPTSAVPSSSPSKPVIENAHAGPSGLASPGSAKADTTRKFAVLLELNAELFKVCQSFVASGYVPQETPEAQPFSKRLDNNLTWMSMHVDNANQVNASRPSLGSIPHVDPPVLAPSAAHITFPQGIFDRINSLYAQLSTLFVNGIARRNQLLASSGTRTPNSVQRNSATPSILPPSGIGVKRERPDSAGYSRMESPTAPKRRDTGEGRETTGPSTPTRSGSVGTGDMAPPATPRFSTPSQSQIARPSSSMSGVGPMNVPGQPDRMFSPSSNPGLNMNNTMQGLGNMGGLSPEAQARARQMQMQQAQAMMLQQQQFQQHQGHQHQQISQHHQNLQQTGHMTVGMSSSQRQLQATPSPTRQQQMMQAQAAAVRQMSPPGTGLGAGLNAAMNGTDNMAPNQQSGGSSNMTQTNMNTNVNGMGTNNVTLNPQVIANMGPGAMAIYQALQNAQHPITQYLNQHMQGFSQLPIVEQMRRFQLFQQRQLNQRNQMMANQMMSGQMRPPNVNTTGSGTPQMQQLGQSGQIGIAPQMQSSTSEGGMQFPGTSTSANIAGGGASSMGIPQLSNVPGMPNVPNLAHLNPQQRQLYLMQMQMRHAGVGGSGLGSSGGVGAGINPAMMNPQLLQERQRLEQQQRLALAQRHGSPLNPALNSGPSQFPPGLRSNPAPSVGISRSGRSPSVSGVGDVAGAATPRIGGRMLPGSEDYQRQVLLQQAQRNAQLQQQQQGFMQGQGQGSWPGQQSHQLPLSAGAWPQQTQQNFAMGSSPPNSGMQGVDFMGPSRQASATPAPMGHQSPTASSNDFDNMMNW